MFKKNLIPSSLFATLAGMAAIIFWSTNIAFSKSLMNSLGNLEAMFMIYFFGGLVMLVFMLIIMGRDFFAKLRNLPLAYYTGTGIFLLLNNTLLYAAIGLAADEKELLIVTILNYLWPMLIYVLKVPVFGLRVKPLLFAAGIFLGMAGVALVFSHQYTAAEFLGLFIHPGNNFLAYLLAVLTAVSWAVYVNFTKKNLKTDDFAALPVLFMLSGLIFLALLWQSGKFQPHSLKALIHNFDLIYTILFPTALGYIFWNISMKNGNKDLVVSMSYLIPLLSVLVIGLKFNTPPGLATLTASLLLISGAWLSYRSIRR
jgi:drug/metabolite transporter (DMT)-like permease